MLNVSSEHSFKLPGNFLMKQYLEVLRILATLQIRVLPAISVKFDKHFLG